MMHHGSGGTGTDDAVAESPMIKQPVGLALETLAAAFAPAE